MPFETFSVVPSPSLYHQTSSSFVGPSYPRFKSAATALLHGYLSPSSNTSNTRHDLTLACRLPEGVMRKVFIYCAELSVEDEDSWSWLNVVYVCSKWRKIAINTPDLWSFIDFSSPRCYSITLERAKMTPLHIETIVSDQNVRLLQRTLQLAHRIKDIHLISSFGHIQPLLQFLAHPNPAVESLCIDIRLPATAQSSDVYYDLPAFPTGGPVLPNLRHMELRCAPFYLITSRCTFLQHLHLHDLPISERPTLPDFLSMLEQLTRLEHLTLDRAFPINMGPRDSLGALGERTPLPKIKSLSLTGSVLEMSNILECLLIPSSAMVACTICTVSDLETQIWKLTQAINELSFNNATEFPIERVVLSGHETSSRFTNEFQFNPQFRQSVRIRTFNPHFANGEASFDITISPEACEARDLVLVNTISTIWKAFALSKAHTLVVQDLDIVTQKTWQTLLRGLPSLRVLDITGRPPSGLVWALLLNVRSQAKEDGNITRFLLPRLSDLYLRNVDCSSGGFMVETSIPVNSYRHLDDSRFLDVLTTSLKARRKCGLCLRSLSMARCDYVYRKAVEEARGAVTHLVCDLRNVRKDEGIVPASPARYWGGDGEATEDPQMRHFHRLRTLLQLDAQHL